MKLSEKLYQLRRRQGLSQEQAAEQLGVSRQAISKWESGQSTPDPDKLAALSRFYHVTTDYLLLEDVPAEPPAQQPAPPPEQRRGAAVGLLLCAAGAVGLLFWGLGTVLLPTAMGHLNTSSAVTLNGSGILVLLCLAALVSGACLLLRKNK